MATIPKGISIDVDLTISEHTADGMCRLLSDYLSAHWDQDIETSVIQGEDRLLREVRLVRREQKNGRKKRSS